MSTLEPRPIGAAEADLITPEAIVLDLPVASVGSRALARLIDVLIVGFVGFAVIFGGSVMAFDFGAWLGTVLILLAVFSALLVYPVAFETLTRGRTPGKMAMGLRVVTVEAGPVQFRHAAVRAALDFVDIWATSGGAAVISALFTRRSQRLGDLAAGTLVIRERSHAGDITPLRFTPPPGTEDYVARLDVTALTEADYQAVRSLVARRGRLDPQMQERLAQQLAGPLVGRISPAPPPQWPAWTFLHAVLAAYQARHASWARPDYADLVWSQSPAPPPPPGTH